MKENAFSTIYHSYIDSQFSSLRYIRPDADPSPSSRIHPTYRTPLERITQRHSLTHSLSSPMIDRLPALRVSDSAAASGNKSTGRACAEMTNEIAEITP